MGQRASRKVHDAQPSNLPPSSGRSSPEQLANRLHIRPSSSKRSKKQSRRSHKSRPTSNLFSSFPLTYLSPSIPLHLRKLFILNGGTVSSSLQHASVYLVAGPTDTLLPTLYMDKMVLYDGAWIEESFLRGKMVDLEGWAIWPWEYRGPAECIPLEIFHGLAPLRLLGSVPADRLRLEGGAESKMREEGRKVMPRKGMTSFQAQGYMLEDASRGNHNLSLQDYPPLVSKTNCLFSSQTSSHTPQASPQVTASRFQRYSPYKTPKRLGSDQAQLSRLISRATKAIDRESPVKRSKPTTRPLRHRGLTDPFAHDTQFSAFSNDATAFRSYVNEKEALTTLQFPRPPLQAMPTNVPLAKQNLPFIHNGPKPFSMYRPKKQ